MRKCDAGELSPSSSMSPNTTTVRRPRASDRGSATQPRWMRDWRCSCRPAGARLPKRHSMKPARHGDEVREPLLHLHGAHPEGEGGGRCREGVHQVMIPGDPDEEEKLARRRLNGDPHPRIGHRDDPPGEVVQRDAVVDLFRAATARLADDAEVGRVDHGGARDVKARKMSPSRARPLPWCGAPRGARGRCW